ncbi:MAG: hypothetical protein HZC39_13625 [Chloroflexi bacterium]|nr:hypothetical protein [Chloroflexota bacterium]MBI5704568.1 hypothetical protein [Chloroflexota bacterium]GER78923.1 conserved hypothetical protein [Candidatus Denitrolinea symbiosum]
MKRARPFIVLALFLALISLSSLAMAAAPVHSSSPAYDITPTPPPTPPPDPPEEGGSVVTSISQIFHHLVFPAETISEALAGIFDKAADKEVRAMSEEVARWTQVIGEIVQAPSQGDYSKVAQSSLPVAAALAPALFLLRLALYHWGRLLGDDDSGLRVVGDWVTAGVLAVVSGPFLDLIVRLGWWMVGKVIGETAVLAVSFVESTTATSVLLGLANLTFLGSLLSIGLSIGSLLAIGGMLFAFASANAVLFILAILAPPLAIASVLPQATWLRSLWLKAVILIALLPVVAGGIFKAGMASSIWLGQQGLLSAIIRVIWLWGATGLLLSLAGILGKMTISTTADAFGQLVKAAQQIIAIGALAASGAGAGAAGVAGTGAAATETGRTASGLSGGEAAMNHLNAAQQLTQRAATFEAMGLHAPASYNRSLAHGHELAARQAELGERMQRFGGVRTESADFGFSPSVNSAIQSNFKGSTEDFQRGFQALYPHISQHGLDPNALAAQYPEDTARMVQAYLDHPEDISQARDPLYHAAELGNASKVQGMITFMPIKDEDDKS